MRRLLLLLVLAVPATAQPLTVPQIMAWGDTLRRALPTALGWDEPGAYFYFSWNPGTEALSDSLYRVARGRTVPEKAPLALQRRGVETFDGWYHGEGVYSSDFRYKVFGRDGDVLLLDRTTGAERPLTRTRDAEFGPRFLPGDTAVVYASDGQLFRHSLTGGTVTQLTDLREGNAPREGKPTDGQAYLDAQQLALFGVLRDARDRREATRSARDAASRASDAPPTYYTGMSNVGGLAIDPTQRFVTFTLTPRTENKTTDVPAWVTESGYTESLRARSKVGIAQAGATLHVQDLTRDTTYAVNLHTLPGTYDVPAYRRTDAPADSSKTKRALRVAGPRWSPDGRYALLDVYALDNKTRWIARLDPATGVVTPLDVQQDDAWIGGPGVSSFGGTFGWMPDGRRFYFQSEATGFSHLYVMDAETGAKQQLTSGTFEVRRPRLSRDGRTFLFESSEESPYEHHLYRMAATGGARTRLTRLRGFNDVLPDPREELLAMLYSDANEPTEVYVQARPNGEVQRVTTSMSAAFRAQPWREAEIVEIPASDGVQVPARIYRPEQPNGAAVLFVHGAGYLQNVHRGWSTYYREYLFHHLLAARGYTVLDLDYRASSGYGRDWRTAIYRHMGGRDLQDYVDASRYVGTEFGVEPERVFIYGGSYGGFITLMALLTEPEHFGGGAALRSVTDWAHYNHGYTANILNTPAEDSLAFAQSSPINFAEGYEGDPLLIAHGMVDTNVHFQDVVRLAQRFIELGKEGWEMAVYPVEDHGFVEPTSWTDEYRRILEYIERSVGPAR